MINRIEAARSYGASRVQQEAIIARSVQDPEIQLRIAKNSDHRLILLNLALNTNLDSEAVQELYDRDIKYLTSRLNALGYKQNNWFNL